jgi:hypothetical protein
MSPFFLSSEESLSEAWNYLPNQNEYNFASSCNLFLIGVRNPAPD